MDTAKCLLHSFVTSSDVFSSQNHLSGSQNPVNLFWQRWIEIFSQRIEIAKVQ